MPKDAGEGDTSPGACRAGGHRQEPDPSRRPPALCPVPLRHREPIPGCPVPRTLGDRGDVLPPEPPATAAGDKVTPITDCSEQGGDAGRTGTGCKEAVLMAGEGPWHLRAHRERRETSSFLPSGNSSPRLQLSVGAQRPWSLHVALETLISLTSGRAAGSQSWSSGRPLQKVTAFAHSQNMHFKKKKKEGKKIPRSHGRSGEHAAGRSARRRSQQTPSPPFPSPGSPQPPRLGRLALCNWL